MTILRFEGVVSYKFEGDSLMIGGKSVLHEVMHTRFSDPVTVAFADERFNGDLEAYHGLEGYSEVTPGAFPEFTVGPHDLLKRLREYNGQQIILWVADEPINTLDPPPSWATSEGV